MEPWELDLIAKFRHYDEELRHCLEEHESLEQRIEELNRRVYLTAEEELERKQLQKVKLAGRDKMEKILLRYRTQTSETL
jgi:uncharacterized protein